MFWNQYPYINLNDLNLDYLLNKLKELEQRLVDFIKINTIKYANPIQWNITTQYEANTVVIDGNTGTAYLSTQPVPSGIALTNTDYWTVIFTLDLLSANQNITFRNDGANVIATFESNVDDWLLWNSQLYKVSRHIAINEAYVEGYNLQRYSVELFIKDYISNLENIIGTLSDLTTSDTDSIVDAINSIITERGALSDLTTSDTDSIVDAINSIITERGNLSDLNTTDKTSIVNAINDVLTTYTSNQIYHSPKEYGAIGDGVTNDTVAIQACITANNLIVFNDGEYLISSPITLHSNMRIVGNGTIYNPTEYRTSFECEGVENVVIEGISFKNGARSGAAYTATNANIKFRNSHNFMVNNIKDDSHNKMASVFASICHDFIIQNCEITKSGYSGIMLYGSCYNGIISNNHINVDNYTQYLNTYGIACSCTGDPSGLGKLYECHHILIDSNILDTELAYWEGIDTHAGSYITITNNVVKGFYAGIALVRQDGFEDTGGTPEHCNVSNNTVIGVKLESELHQSRTEIYGIRYIGNSTIFADGVISNNTIQDVAVTRGGNPIGFGIEVNGMSLDISNNHFKRSIDRCIHLWNVSIINFSNNVYERATGSFVYFDKAYGAVIIANNTMLNGNNFYEIGDKTGINMIERYNNKLVNGYWKDNTPNVTNITNFVPDYVNASPVGSNYHPRNAIALKSVPTTGQPIGWISDGTTWHAMSNLA